MTHHNELRDGVADLSIKTFTSRMCATIPSSTQVFTCVRESSICPGHKPTIFQTAGMRQSISYILIHYLWKIGTDRINDLRVMNTDANYYQNKLSEKYLQTV